MTTRSEFHCSSMTAHPFIGQCLREDCPEGVGHPAPMVRLVLSGKWPDGIADELVVRVPIKPCVEAGLALTKAAWDALTEMAP